MADRNGESLSNTTKLILLDSLLQEVCFSSGFEGSLTLEFAWVEFLSLSVTNFFLFRAKESSLKSIKMKNKTCCNYNHNVVNVLKRQACHTD